MARDVDNSVAPIEVFEGTLVKLHKVLKGNDADTAELRAAKRGDPDGRNPTIVIDFQYVTSIQKDFLGGGTVVMDAKTACIVIEPLEEVLEAWCEVKRNLDQP